MSTNNNLMYTITWNCVPITEPTNLNIPYISHIICHNKSWPTERSIKKEKGLKLWNVLTWHIILEGLKKTHISFTDTENTDFDKNEHSNKNHRTHEYLQRSTIKFNDKISQKSH